MADRVAEYRRLATLREIQRTRREQAAQLFNNAFSVDPAWHLSDVDDEEAIASSMDTLWYAMTDAERAELDRG